MTLRLSVLAAVFALIFAASARAGDWEKYDKPVPTKIVVRVLAHGAGAINQDQGALVVIWDAETGSELARGMTKGAAGVEKAAKYETTLMLTKPTMLNIEAYGPLVPPHSTVSAMVKVWAFPGEAMTGEGATLELRGLIVDALASLKDAEIKVSAVEGGVIRVPFYLEMLSGSPVAPGGEWEAKGFRITTQAYYKGGLYYEDTETADKLYAKVGAFETTVPLPKDLPAGDYKRERAKIRIMAAQPAEANYGLDEFDMYLSK